MHPPTVTTTTLPAPPGWWAIYSYILTDGRRFVEAERVVAWHAVIEPGFEQDPTLLPVSVGSGEEIAVPGSIGRGEEERYLGLCHEGDPWPFAEFPPLTEPGGVRTVEVPLLGGGK